MKLIHFTKDQELCLISGASFCISVISSFWSISISAECVKRGHQVNPFMYMHLISAKDSCTLSSRLVDETIFLGCGRFDIKKSISLIELDLNLRINLPNHEF